MDKGRRIELDGLRGMAVVLVLLFHLDLNIFGQDLFRGGFLGVDIFFVLSGYFITRQILQAITANQFSLLWFYEKRVRRILPPLFITLLLTLALGWLFVMPSDLLRLSWEALTSSLMVANVYFYKQDGYGALIHSKSLLLHTWTLSAEEQFYLIFPLLVLGVQKLKKTVQVESLSLIGCVFFTLWLVFSSNGSAVFFLSPFRFWQFLAGSWVAYILQNEETRHKFQAQDWVAVLAMQITIVGIVLGDSLYAIMPRFLVSLGSAVLILTLNPSGVLGRVLSMRPLVFLGLISYSLYLFHFPLFQLAKIMNSFDGDAMKISLTLLSLFLATVSWRFYESPLRAKALKFKFVSLVLVLQLSLILVFLGHLLETEGGKYRVGETLTEMMHEMESLDHSGGGPAENKGRNIEGEIIDHCFQRDPMDPCVFGNGDWVLLGDSFAGQLQTSLLKNLKEKSLGLVSQVYSACPYFSSFLEVPSAQRCSLVNAKRQQYFRKLDRPRTIVVVANTDIFPQAVFVMKPQNLQTNARDYAYQSYQENIRQLLKWGHRVVVLKNYPKPKKDAVQAAFSGVQINALIDKPIFPKIYMSKKSIIENNYASQKLQFLKHKNLKIIEMSDLFCETKQRCLLVTEEGPLFGRDHHLSPVGARKVLNKIFDETNL